jgi:hypothetical protein
MIRDQHGSTMIKLNMPDSARYLFCQISVRLWRSSKSWSFNRRCQQGLPKLHSELSDVEREREAVCERVSQVHMFAAHVSHVSRDGAS